MLEYFRSWGLQACEYLLKGAEDELRFTLFDFMECAIGSIFLPIILVVD